MRALAFSGGKDSWACLWLNKDKLDDLTVIWVDTGMNYPETLELIEKAKKLCKKFVTVKSDRGGNTFKFGLPSEVVPVDYTAIGQTQTGGKSILVQSYLDCCYANIASPLMDACKKLGVTTLIRGQRSEEGHKSTARNGDKVMGIVFEQPIEDWTGLEVLDYLSKHMDIPEHFNLKHSSLDCYDCSAYLEDTYDQLLWAKEKHPSLYEKKVLNINLVKESLYESLRRLNRIT